MTVDGITKSFQVTGFVQSVNLQGELCELSIEGYNSRIRHYLARFKRKTKCYSKSVQMIESSLNLLFAKWGGDLGYIF